MLRVRGQLGCRILRQGYADVRLSWGGEHQLQPGDEIEYVGPAQVMMMMLIVMMMMMVMMVMMMMMMFMVMVPMMEMMVMMTMMLMMVMMMMLMMMMKIYQRGVLSQVCERNLL